MSNLTDRLRALYVQHGTNYVQEAADAIDKQSARIAEFEAQAREHALQRVADFGQIQELERERDALRSELAEARRDSERLDFVQREYLNINSFDMPTGGDDSDVGWSVHIEAMNPADGFRHDEFRDDVRAAIDAAMASESKGPVDI